MFDPATLAAIAAAAAAAPSADNRHEFRIETEGDRLVLRAHPELRTAHPRRQHLALLSSGAVVENMHLRAARFGIRLRCLQVPRLADLGLLAVLVAEPMPAAPDPLEPAIERRHTNRRLRFRGPMPEGVLARLEKEASTIEGQRLVAFDTPDRRSPAIAALWRAERERFRHPELHAELYDAVRLDLALGVPADVGIPVRALELNSFERRMFSALRRWPLQRAANWLGADATGAARSVALPCRLTPHLGAIVSAEQSAAALQGAGRALQRVWLAAQTAGLAFQAFAALPVYVVEGLAPLQPAVRKALAAALRRLVPDGAPQIFFRVGRAAPASQRSGRPSGEGVLAQAAKPEEHPHVE